MLGAGRFGCIFNELISSQTNRVASGDFSRLKLLGLRSKVSCFIFTNPLNLSCVLFIVLFQISYCMISQLKNVLKNVSAETGDITPRFSEVQSFTLVKIPL